MNPEKVQLDVKDWGGRGQSVRTYESLPLHSVSFIELTYHKPREGSNGECMGGSYTAGIVAGELDGEAFACGNGVYTSNQWWGISDTGGIWSGAHGIIGQLPPESMNDYGVAFGCGDRVGFAVDMPEGTIEFFRNGDLIPHAKISNLPTISNNMHVVASPFNMGASVQLSVFELSSKDISAQPGSPTSIAVGDLDAAAAAGPRPAWT